MLRRDRSSKPIAAPDVTFSPLFFSPLFCACLQFMVWVWECSVCYRAAARFGFAVAALARHVMMMRYNSRQPRKHVNFGPAVGKKGFVIVAWCGRTRAFFFGERIALTACAWSAARLATYDGGTGVREGDGASLCGGRPCAALEGAMWDERSVASESHCDLMGYRQCLSGG